MSGAGRASRAGGFTLIELITVFAIIALLLTIALPRYQNSVLRSKEAVLRQNLGVMREAIDRFYSDKGRYPDSIADLARDRYIRALPVDPITESADSWQVVPPREQTQGGRVYDVRSGAPGTALDGSKYEDW